MSLCPPRWLALSIPLCFVVPTQATDLTTAPLLKYPVGSVAIGAAVRYQQSSYLGQDSTASQFSNYDYDLLPLYYYQGRRLFVRGTQAGVDLWQGDLFTASALVSYRFDRLEAGLKGELAGLKEREQALEAGIQLAWNGPWGQLQAQYLKDTQNTHKGSEWALKYQYQWRSGRWRLAPFVSYLRQDADFSDYYYGVDATEVRVDRPAYRADGGDSWRAGLRASYQWTERFSLFANASLTGLSDAASDSPLVERDTAAQVLAGLTYRMGNVASPDIDSTLDRNAERLLWSWRVQYGYTAQETFHKVHRGYLQRNRDVHTRLAGVTVGRLIDDGDKVDFWLKGSVNRRLENDLQPDSWEFNLYTMAMGTGYSPFSGRELFRYGFGFGFSYADRIPAIERIKQAGRGERDGHFLNYLEAQVDTPLSNLFGKRAWRNCYVGLTLVHRSGIFGSSDLLDNVSGGSDVVTGHLECKR